MANLSDLMQKAQEMQGRMSEMQNELGELRHEGESGAGLVKVTLNGRAEMISLKIDESLAKPDEIEILEDLIIAAYGDAKAKMERAVKEKMSELTGGLPLPPGLNPF
jgi:DNA-binding YbaB/EbfC family protein